MTYFTMGYWVLGLAIGVSMAGALVGLACVRQSRQSVTARFRMVWLSAAAVSVGGVGTCLAIYVTMLGVGVRTGQIRYDLIRMVFAAIVAIVAVLFGLLVAGRNSTTLRLILGTLLAGIGAGCAHFLGMSAVAVQGSVQLNVLLAVGAGAVGVVSMLILLWGATRMDNMLTLTGVALLFAAAINGMHYIGLAGVRAHLDPMAVAPSGRDLFTLFVPVFVLGTLSLAVPITAVLVAPDRSHRPSAARPAPLPVG